MASTKDKTVNFMVCVINNEESYTAMRFACKRAANCNGNVTLLHIVEPPNSESVFSIADKIKEENLVQGEELLRKMQNEAKEILGFAPEALLREGNLKEVVVESTKEETHAASLLVVGSTSHHPGSSNLTSWLSSRIGDEIRIPLVLVPGNLTEEEIERLA